MEDLAGVVTRVNELLGLAPGPATAPHGLLSGDLRRPVRRMLLATAITAEVAREAAGAGADLLLALSGPRSPDLVGAAGEAWRVLVGGDVAVHTVSEAAPRLVAGATARALDLEARAPILPRPPAPYAVLIAYVPEEDAEALRRSLAAAGAGRIGDYEGCAWSVTGTGEFTPTHGANPTIGHVGAHEHVRERRLEMVVPVGEIDVVTAALRRAHPYEEPAFSFLATHPAPGREGQGVVGDLPEPTDVRDLAQALHRDVSGAQPRIAGGGGRVARVAVAAASSPDLIAAAARAGAELLVAADLTSTDVMLAHEAGLGLLDLPGAAMRWAALPLLARTLGADLAEHVETIVSTRQGPAWRTA